MISALRTMLGTEHRLRLTFVLIGMLIGAALEMAAIAAVSAFVALITDPSATVGSIASEGVRTFLESRQPTELVLIGALTLAGLFTLKNTYLTLLILSEGRLLRDIATSTANRLYRAYLCRPYTFHLQRNPAVLIRNITTEVDGASDLIRNIAVLLRESLVLIIVFIVLLVIDPLVSIAVFVFVGGAAATFYLAVRRPLLDRGQLAQRHRGRRLQAITQGFGAIKDAKLLGREPQLIATVSAETEAIEKYQLYPRVIVALPRLVLELVGIIGVLLVILVLVLLDRGVQGMLPLLALLAVAVTRLVPALNAVTASLGNIRYDAPALEVVSQELKTLEREFSPARSRGRSNFKLKSEISVRDLCYRYPESTTLAVRGVSLDIHVGEMVAVVGPSGAGKSTLIDVMVGLLVPSAGRVCVDGIELGEMLPDWQSQVGYVPQDFYLIDDSIRRNVAFGLPDNEVDGEAVIRALQIAHLHSFVLSLPKGDATVVGSRGVRLSGGQRQRLAIARALYHDPAVVVMDEGTSALDAKTERDIIQTIAEVRQGRTVVMIAHRLTTVRTCDRVFLMRDGGLADEGTFVEVALRNRDLHGSLAATTDGVGSS